MARRNPLLALLILIALVGLSCWSIYLVKPPEALPATAPTNEFSAGRAMTQLRQIARGPHAMGTPEHARVRAYLAEQLRQLGLTPVIQDTTVIASRGDVVQAGHVYNIVGRLKGQTTGKAVLLMAHYDSQPNTPGAADDGAGVVAILETVRALRQGPALKNDIIVLLTDGEEYGLLGAQAFLLHPWAKDVGFVINLEARGNGGPSMTFEISPENGWVVDEFAKAAPVPFASSLMYEVYRALPNDTDFSVFREAGYTGVNSAFIDGFVNYHKLTDTPDDLDQNSLQHHGSNMLALARHFGNLSLTQTKAPDKVFFNPAGSWLIQYPSSVTLILLAILGVLLVITFLVARKKEILSIGQCIGSVFLYLILLIVIGGLFIPINMLVRHFLPYAHNINGVYGSGSFFIGYLLIAISLFFFLTRLAIRWVRPFSLVMGVYSFLFIITAVLAFLVPSSAYIFQFPLLVALAGTLIVLMGDLHRAESGYGYAGVMLLALLPTVFMLMPMVNLLFVTFALQLPSASMAVLTLVLGLCLPLLIGPDRSLQWKAIPALPILLVVLGIGQTAYAIRQEQPSDDRPLHNHLSYFLNADDQQAIWATAYPTTNDWNKQFFPKPSLGPLNTIYPHAQTTYLKNAAERIQASPPVAQLLTDSTTATEHILTIQLSSPRGAAHMEALLQPKQESDLISLSLNGQSIDKTWAASTEGKLVHLYILGLPTSKTMILKVAMKLGRPLRIRLYDHSIGLPADLIKTPPPAHIIPEQGRNSNVTIVRKTYQF